MFYYVHRKATRDYNTIQLTFSDTPKQTILSCTKVRVLLLLLLHLVTHLTNYYKTQKCMLHQKKLIFFHKFITSIWFLNIILLYLYDFELKQQKQILRISFQFLMGFHSKIHEILLFCIFFIYLYFFYYFYIFLFIYFILFFIFLFFVISFCIYFLYFLHNFV